MPICTCDAATIWFEDRSEGEPVLLIHGGLFDPMDGERFAEARRDFGQCLRAVIGGEGGW